MVQVIEIPVVTYIVEIRCECGALMQWDGCVLTSNPPQYEHDCPACGKSERLSTRSGHLEYKRQS